MKGLPKRYVYCATILLAGDFIPSGESAARLLWMCPRLLGWKRRIYWLLLRVVDAPRKSRWMLWGIDSAGQIIIVEAKMDRSEAVDDPFKSLLRDVKTGSELQAWATKVLRHRWRESFVQHDLPNDLSVSRRRAIERAFDVRRAAGDPAPIFVVLVASRRSSFRLSEQGLRNLWLLQELVGSSRILLRAIKGSVRLKRLRIDCWSPRSCTLRKRRTAFGGR